MRRILGDLWTNRREAERLEVLSRNSEIDAKNDRLAQQALEDYVRQRHASRKYENDLPLDSGGMA